MLLSLHLVDQESVRRGISENNKAIQNSNVFIGIYVYHVYSFRTLRISEFFQQFDKSKEGEIVFKIHIIYTYFFLSLSC